jgi:hypothetical protein
VFKSKSAVPYPRAKSEDAGKSWHILVALPLLAVACIMIGVWIGRITVPTATDGIDLLEAYKQQSDTSKTENSMKSDSINETIEKSFSTGTGQNTRDKRRQGDLARNHQEAEETKQQVEYEKAKESEQEKEKISDDWGMESGNKKAGPE